LTLHLRERAAQDCEILGINANHTAADFAKTHHHCIPRMAPLVHTKIAVTVGPMCIDLSEATFIKQMMEALTGGLCPSGMLGLDLLKATTYLDLFTLLFQFRDHGRVILRLQVTFTGTPVAIAFRRIC
jgi:hypothetical protein